jgi:hypothetical protein
MSKVLQRRHTNTASWVWRVEVHHTKQVLNLGEFELPSTVERGLFDV